MRLKDRNWEGVVLEQVNHLTLRTTREDVTFVGDIMQVGAPMEVHANSNTNVPYVTNSHIHICRKANNFNNSYHSDSNGGGGNSGNPPGNGGKGWYGNENNNNYYHGNNNQDDKKKSYNYYKK